MKTKICKICHKEKPLSQFHKHRFMKYGVRSVCKLCRKTGQDIEYRIKNRKKINKRVRNYYKKYPWKKTFIDIKNRCYNIHSQDYKNYGGRGIKCLITEEELKRLWFRDKAYNIKKPTIDRIDNDGNYTFKNCQYIEREENIAKDKRKPILQYDLEGNFIKEWESITNAKKIYGGSIFQNLTGKFKQAYGFVWKYKN